MRALLASCLLAFSTGLAAQDTLPGDKAAALRLRLRGLWEQQSYWTRDYLKDALARHPERRAVSGRLLRVQDEIGGVFAEYYGEEAGRRVAAFLREQVAHTEATLAAARRKDSVALSNADAKWRENAGRMADYLGSLNPYWGRDPTHALLDERVTWTQREVMAQLERDWAADLPAFDGGLEHARRVADAIAAGLVDAFPGRS